MVVDSFLPSFLKRNVNNVRLRPCLQESGIFKRTDFLTSATRLHWTTLQTLLQYD